MDSSELPWLDQSTTDLSINLPERRALSVLPMSFLLLLSQPRLSYHLHALLTSSPSSPSDDNCRVISRKQKLSQTLPFIHSFIRSYFILRKAPVCLPNERGGEWLNCPLYRVSPLPEAPRELSFLSRMMKEEKVLH